MKRGFRWALIFLASVLTFLIIISGVIFLSTNKILPNTYVNEIDVSDLTKDEAILKLKESYGENIQDAHLTLVCEDKVWDLKYSDINFAYSFDEAVDEAYRIGRTGNIFKRYFDSINARLVINEIPLNFSYNEENIIKTIDAIAEKINRSPIDATIRLKSGKFVVTSDIPGLKLQNNNAVEIIKKKIENYDISKIELPIEIIESEIKKSDLENITEKLGEYTTRFDATNTSRTYNIALATKSVTDVLIKPGEIFSLNKIIGPRLAEKGYKIAKVIINNEYVDGIGGGLCQVSTTLYNAALLSNMKIIERKNHSMPSDYVALGRDATISGDYIDMKFENNSNHPIYIYGEVKGNKVMFSIYGKKENPNRSIEIRTSVLKKIEPQIKVIHDDTLPVGTEIIEKKARAGYVVKSYRVVLENGKEVFVEPLYTDTYRVSDGVKRIGIKPVDIVQDAEDLSLEIIN